MSSDYLNNRYHDPATGVFLSVDPLVAKTGMPYLYGNGNPTTLSDPLGLEPCPRAGCDGSERDSMFATVQVGIEPIPGGGTIKIDQFIAAGKAGLPGAHDDGNHRGFDPLAPAWASKVQIVVDLDAGTVSVIAAPTCDFQGNGCHHARAWEVVASPSDKPSKKLNNISVEQDGPRVRIQFRALNGRRDDRSLLKIPSIDGVYSFELPDNGNLSASTKGDPYPSELVTWTDPSGEGHTLFKFSEKVNAISRTPRLSTHSWKGLSDDYRLS